MKALLNKIIIKELEDKSLIRSTENSETRRGTVVSIGATSALNGTLAVGDTVIFSGYSGAKFTFESQEYVILQELEVSVVV